MLELLDNWDQWFFLKPGFIFEVVLIVAFCIDLDLLQVFESACNIKLSEKGGRRISSLLVLTGLKFALRMKLLCSVETETLPCVFRSRTLNVWKSSVYEAWWVDLSQMPTQQLSHSPSSEGQKENKLKKLMGQGKAREIATNYHHWQNRLDWEKINLIYCQLTKHWMVKNKDKLKQHFPHHQAM